VPSHEHRYVTVYFKPAAVRTYAAALTGTVTDGEAAHGGLLAVSLVGVGTLPTIAVERPLERTADGAAVLIDLGRAYVGKRRSATVSLRNGGIVSAVGVLSGGRSTHFLFAGGEGSAQLEPGDVKDVSVVFR